MLKKLKTAIVRNCALVGLLGLDILATAACLSAQTGSPWTFTVELSGQPSGQLRLLRYDQGRLVPFDSLRWSSGWSQGQFRYPQAPKLGLYALQWNDQSPIDFVVNGESRLHWRSQAQHFWDSLRILESPENLAFFTELKAVQSQQLRLQQLSQTANQASAAALTDLHRQIQAINAASQAAARRYAKAHPGSLSAKILLASQNPVAPAQLLPYLNGQPNLAYWTYLRQHYWETYDFNDERLLDSPILYQKLPIYFGQLVSPQVDSIKKAIDQLLSAPKAERVRTALLRWLSDYYDNLKVYGGDAALVHLVDHYYRGAKALEIDSILYLRRKNRADIFRINPTGNIATPIELPDPEGRKQALAAVGADFTVLYFFSPFCSHCQEVTPQLAALSTRYEPKRLQVYAVAGEQPSQWPAWRTYIAREAPNWVAVMAESEASPIFDDFGAYQLPVIYLLDRDKRILAKYLTIEQLQAYLGVLLP